MDIFDWFTLHPNAMLLLVVFLIGVIVWFNIPDKKKK